MKTRFLLVLLFFPTVLFAQVNVTEDENYFWQKRELFKEIIWGLISEEMDTTGCVEDPTHKDKIFIQWSQDSTGAKSSFIKSSKNYTRKSGAIWNAFSF